MKQLRLLVLVVLIFGSGYFAGLQNSRSPATAQNDPGMQELFQPYWEAWNTVNGRYVDPLDQETLMIGSIRGMFDAIGDPNSYYMTPEDMAQSEASLNNQFSGIGATVQKDSVTGGLSIVRPIEGSPAQAAGLRPGDIILTVDGEDITGMEQSEIIRMVRGPAGTPVTLGIKRAGEEELFEVTIIRAVIDLPSVEYRMLDNNIGYIQYYIFSQDAVVELTNALVALDANNLNGLVLDVRGNPGGYLSVALDTLSLFVKEGPILIEQLPGGEEQVHVANEIAIAPDVPLAVLVDQGSASASELIAGSLRDLDRAVIVGMPTFGKGTVQVIIPLSNGGAARVTIARWVTPIGTSVEPDGLIPDVQVELDPASDLDNDNQLQAAVRALKGLKRNQAFYPLEVRI